jgi:hypothetical protein
MRLELKLGGRSPWKGDFEANITVDGVTLTKAGIPANCHPLKISSVRVGAGDKARDYQILFNEPVSHLIVRSIESQLMVNDIERSESKTSYRV